jgi:hypothetical protein
MHWLLFSLIVVAVIFAILIATLGIIATCGILFIKALAGDHDERSAAPNPVEESTLSSTLAKSVFSGTMPDSIRVKGRVYRYNPRARHQAGEDFWRLFVDGDWKWNIQQRYAGAHVNPGYYFTFAKEAAAIEIGHYIQRSGEPLDVFDLLAVEGEIDNILDLTNLETIGKAALARGVDQDPLDTLLELLEEADGGGDMTDRLGHYGFREGYNGIVFFSARTVVGDHRAGLERSSPSDLVRFQSLELVYQPMRRDVMRMCLVVFRGATLLRSIKCYSYNEEPMQDNPFWTKPLRGIRTRRR